MYIISGFFKALAFGLGGLWMMLRIAVVNLFMGPKLERSLRYRQQFINFLLWMLRVKVEHVGKPPAEAGLIMCNHRSYFDPVPVLHKVYAVPVGKAEVRSWPVIGLGGHLSGTVYVDRSSSEGRQAARDKINQRLESGHSILIYPEGTIHPGPALGELKMGMFRDAAKHGYTIHPVAIEYKTAFDLWTQADGFVKHFFTRFGSRKVSVKVSYGPPLRSESAQELADRFKAWTEEEVKRLRVDWFSERVTR